jgi:hypothetical protein
MNIETITNNKAVIPATNNMNIKNVPTTSIITFQFLQFQITYGFGPNTIC